MPDPLLLRGGVQIDPIECFSVIPLVPVHSIIACRMVIINAHMIEKGVEKTEERIPTQSENISWIIQVSM
jgi:hypothetical protein